MRIDLDQRYNITKVTKLQDDLKNKRMFMKRMPCAGLSVRELFLGSIVNVHARQLKLVDYGDVFTRTKFEAQAGRTFALIKPDCYI